jgi:hypothetical protein
VCVLCSKRFRSRRDFHRHVKKHRKLLPCEFCGYGFSSNYKLEIHINSYHRCQFCDFESNDAEKMNEHREECHSTDSPIIIQASGRKKNSPYPFCEINAFQGYLKTCRQRARRMEKAVLSISDYFRLYGANVMEILSYCLKNHRSIKVQITIIC